MTAVAHLAVRPAWYVAQLARQSAARAATPRQPRAPRVAAAILAERHRIQERRRYWHDRYGIEPPTERPVRVPRASRVPVSIVPIPDVPEGHPLYDEARRALLGYERDELGHDMDVNARDVLQEFVLAVLEGRDPIAAIRDVRAAAYKRRKTFVYGLSLTSDLVR